MDFQNWVILEAMRFDSPAIKTSVREVLDDFEVGKYKFKKGTFFLVYIIGLH